MTTYNLNLSPEKLQAMGAMVAVYEQIHSRIHPGKNLNFNSNKAICNPTASLIYYATIKKDAWEEKRLAELIDELDAKDLPIGLTVMQQGTAMMGYYRERNLLRKMGGGALRLIS